MPTTRQPITESHSTLHRNGSKPGQPETIFTDSQALKPTVDYQRLLWIAQELLSAIGENPARDGLMNTPRRFANWWKEFIEYQPGTLDTTFESISAGQVVTVSGIRVWSLCEHHLLPFWCDIAIGYIPQSKTLGLSKFARIAHHCAHRLQVQERLVEQIAEMIAIETGSTDIGVIATGQHLCMAMRGIKTPGLMTTYTGLGQFNTEPTRQFFLQMVKHTLGD